MNKKRLLFITIFIILLFTTVVYWQIKPFSQIENKQQTKKPINQQTQNSPQPSSIPFERLTIPYLKQKVYDGSVNKLEQYRQNNNYTSYTTSYDSENLKINALLTLPNQEKPENGWPAIVFVHGYIPPNQYQTTQRYQDYVDYLARNNFVVFKIDLRGHGNSEGEPSSAYYSSDYVIDTLNTYQALEKLDFVNPDKIGLWGHSMAGNIIIRSILAKPDIPAAVVWSGSVFTYQDFIDYGIDDDSYQPPDPDSPRRKRRQELFDTYGRFRLESNFWSQVSPLDYLSDIQGSIQLHHATNDNVVNIEYSRNIYNLLMQNNINSEIYEYQQGGHNLVSPAFSNAMNRTVNFFKNQL